MKTNMEKNMEDIFNLPVDTKPRYITEIVESTLGIEFQGCSVKLTIGINIKTAQINIEPVTF